MAQRGAQQSRAARARRRLCAVARLAPCCWRCTCPWWRSPVRSASGCSTCSTASKTATGYARSDWDPNAAAVDGSSFYDLPAVLRWITGNIGYHHIHHLAPRIPNYHLRAAHEALPHARPAATGPARQPGLRAHEALGRRTRPHGGLSAPRLASSLCWVAHRRRYGRCLGCRHAASQNAPVRPSTHDTSGSTRFSTRKTGGDRTRFLIIDDDRKVGMSLSFMLETRGYPEVRAVRSPPGPNRSSVHSSPAWCSSTSTCRMPAACSWPNR